MFEEVFEEMPWHLKEQRQEMLDENEESTEELIRSVLGNRR